MFEPEVKTSQETAQVKTTLVKQGDDLIGLAVSLVESVQQFSSPQMDQQLVLIIHELGSIHARVESQREYDAEEIPASSFRRNLQDLQRQSAQWLKDAEAASKNQLQGAFTEPLPTLMKELAAIATLNDLQQLVKQDQLQPDAELKDQEKQIERVTRTGQRNLNMLFAALDHLSFIPHANTEGSALFGKQASVLEDGRALANNEVALLQLHQFLAQNGFRNQGSLEFTGQVTLDQLFSQVETFVMEAEKTLESLTSQSPQVLTLQRQLTLSQTVAQEYISAYRQIIEKKRQAEKKAANSDKTTRSEGIESLTTKITGIIDKIIGTLEGEN